MALHWRRVLEHEQGTPRIVPPANCQVALIYPNTYAVGMSSLGYQMVYRWINEQPGALAERFFCEGIPALSVENQRPLEQFDLVAFSIAYELDLLDVVRFLMENRVRLLAAERDPKAEPIIIAGGICLLVNRLPVYDLADVLVVGDGEGTVGQIVREWVVSGGDRRHFLQTIAPIEGIEVTEGACRRFGLDLPAAAISDPRSAASEQQLEVENRKSKIEDRKSVRPHFVRSLDSADAFSAIVTRYTELGERCLVEIARGCPYGCRFCFLGHSLPYRPRPFEAVREMIERGRRLTPRFGLIAPAVGSHPDIGRICEWCLGEGLEISFSSLRLEDVTCDMLNLLAASGQRSLTIAPEAGSERLRQQLGKNLTNAHVIAFAAEAAARGLANLRMYFMVGLPTEQREDIEAIARLVEATRRTAMAARRDPQVSVRVEANVSVFVPKPGTPLAEWETPSSAQIRKHLKRLGALLGRLDGVRLRMPSFAEAEAQRILTWADRGVLRTLIETARSGGSWRHFVGLAGKK